MIMRFFPEYFLVVILRGLMRKLGNGGRADVDPIMKPSLTSLASSRLTPARLWPTGPGGLAVDKVKLAVAC